MKYDYNTEEMIESLYENEDPVSVEGAEHMQELFSHITELEKENTSLKKGVQRLDFILDHVCIETPVNSTCWYSLIGLNVSGDFYQREGSIRELFVSDVDEAIKEANA